MEGEALCNTYSLPHSTISDGTIPSIPRSPVAIARLGSSISEVPTPSFSDCAMIYAGEILADSIEAPMALGQQFPRTQTVFASSIVTTITSLIHAYYIPRVGGLIVVCTALIEAAHGFCLHINCSRSQI